MDYIIHLLFVFEMNYRYFKNRYKGLRLDVWMLLSHYILKINDQLWPFLFNHVSVLIYLFDISLLLNKINEIILPHFQHRLLHCAHADLK